MNNSVWQRKKRGARKTSWKERIRDQRCIDKCEITRSKTFGIFSKTRIWKQFAGKHSGLRITVRNNSIHKGCEGASFVHRVSAGMSYKTRPDEDDGFGRIIPLCREFFAAIPGGTIIGPVIEVQIVKILDRYGLEIASPSPMIQHGQPLLWYPDERVGSWMKFIFPMPNSDPVQNYSLNFRKQKEENLAWHSRRLQETGAAHVTSQTQGNLCGHSQRFSQPSVLFQTKNHSPTTERKWKVIPANSSYGGALPTAVSKMVTRMVRHYDQDERQSDAALHWDTIRPVLLKAFAKHGARDFSDWKTLASTHSWRKQQDEVRVLRGFQKFLGLLPSNSRTLWWNNNWRLSWWSTFWFLTIGKSIFFTGLFFQHPIYPGERTHSRWKKKQGRTTDYLLHTTQSFREISDEEAPSIPMYRIPCTITAIGNVIGCLVKNISAQDQGLQFMANESHAIIVSQSCASRLHLRVISQNGDRILFERLSTPRPTPRVTLKSTWHSQQQQQSLCDDVSTSTRETWCTTGLGQGQRQRRMIRLVQGNLYGIPSQLLTKSHNSKSIFE